MVYIPVDDQHPPQAKGTLSVPRSQCDIIQKAGAFRCIDSRVVPRRPNQRKAPLRRAAAVTNHLQHRQDRTRGQACDGAVRTLDVLWSEGIGAHEGVLALGQEDVPLPGVEPLSFPRVDCEALQALKVSRCVAAQQLGVRSRTRRDYF